MRISLRAVIFELLLAVTFAAVAGVAAFYLSHRLTSGFEATVDYRAADDATLTGFSLDAYREVASSDEVLKRALAELGEPGAGFARIAALRREVGAVVVTGSDGEPRLRITATGDALEEAAQRAEALATALESWDRSATPARAAQAAVGLDERIADLGERIRSLQVLDSPDEEIAELVVERERLVALRQRAADGTLPGAVLERVDSGSATAEPDTTRNVALAASAAAFLSLLLGLRRPRRRTPPLRRAPTAAGRGQGRLQPGPALRLLGSYPNSNDPKVLRRAGAQLRATLATLLPEVRPQVVLVTGLNEGCGASTVARYLAEAAARRRTATLLVDADLREPGVADAYRLTEQSHDAATTLDWLQDPTAAPRFAQVEIDGGVPLDVVPQFRAVRPAPGTAGALFAGFGEAVRHWDGYDLVVVDAAPVRSVDDTRLLARWATGVVVVATPGSYDERSWSEVRRSLGAAASSVTGLIENEAPTPPTPRSEVEPPQLRIRDAGAASTGTRRPAKGRSGRDRS